MTRTIIRNKTYVSFNIFVKNINRLKMFSYSG